MKIEYEELNNNELVNLANEAVLITTKNDSTLKNIVKKIIDKNYILNVQNEILEDKIYPSY